MTLMLALFLIFGPVFITSLIVGPEPFKSLTRKSKKVSYTEAGYRVGYNAHYTRQLEVSEFGEAYTDCFCSECEKKAATAARFRAINHRINPPAKVPSGAFMSDYDYIDSLRNSFQKSLMEQQLRTAKYLQGTNIKIDSGGVVLSNVQPDLDLIALPGGHIQKMAAKSPRPSTDYMGYG